MLLKYLFIISFLLVLLFSKSDVCMEYNSSNFILQKYSYSNGKVDSKKYKLDNFKIYFFKDRSSTKAITLEYSINNHKKYYKYIFCMNDKDKEWCGIECDGGGFYANKYLDIYIKYPLRVAGEPESDLADIEISQLNNKYIKGKSFKCPSKLPKVEKAIDDKYYKDNKDGKFVCYDYKDKSNYYGCFRSIKSCKVLHLQHFGKYSTKKETKEALNRCKDSKPNVDYLDNPKGKYVCYSYIDSSGDYSGCFRSIKSCKDINKRHFGYYLTIKDSKKALIRCKISLPKK